MKKRAIIAEELKALDPSWGVKFATLREAAVYYDLDELWYETYGIRLVDDRLERYNPIMNVGEAFQYIEDMGIDSEE